MSFSDRIRQLRKENGLTQIELAKDINISDSTIKRYEIGPAEPTMTAIITLANYFNVSTDFLLGLSDIRDPGIVQKTDAVIERDQLVTQYEDSIKKWLNRLSPSDKERILSALAATIECISRNKTIEQSERFSKIVLAYGSMILESRGLRRKSKSISSDYLAFLREFEYLKKLINEHRECIERKILAHFDPEDEYRKELKELFSISDEHQ